MCRRNCERLSVRLLVSLLSCDVLVLASGPEGGRERGDVPPRDIIERNRIERKRRARVQDISLYV